MSRVQVLAAIIAVAIHGTLLLFGGLLIPHVQDGGPRVEEVDLIGETPAEEEKEAEEKEKAEAQEPEEQQEAQDESEMTETAPVAPEMSDLSRLEAPVEAPALAPMSLSELSSALSGASGGSGEFASGFTLSSGGRIGGTGVAGVEESGDQGVAAIVSIADLDQRPRLMFQTPPRYPLELRRRKVGGTVQVVFLVDTEGRVTSPRVESSTNAEFDQPALEAVRQWRFEAGTRGGQKVSFKMRVPITFSAS